MEAMDWMAELRRLGGAASVRQLRAAGATERALRNAVAAGRLVRPRAGRYVLPDAAEPLVSAVRAGCEALVRDGRAKLRTVGRERRSYAPQDAPARGKAGERGRHAGPPLESKRTTGGDLAGLPGRLPSERGPMYRSGDRSRRARHSHLFRLHHAIRLTQGVPEGAAAIAQRGRARPAGLRFRGRIPPPSAAHRPRSLRGTADRGARSRPSGCAGRRSPVRRGRRLRVPPRTRSLRARPAA